MSDQLTAAHLDWAGKFCGVPGITSQPNGATKDGAPASGGTKFAQEVPHLPKKSFKVWNNKLEIELAPVLKISGIASLTDNSSAADPQAVAQAAEHVATNWHATTAEPAFTSGNLINNMKIGRQGSALGVTGSADTPLGKLSLEVVLVSVGVSAKSDASAKLGLKIGTAKVAIDGKHFKLPDTDIEGLRLTDLGMDVGASVEAGPNWGEILTQWAWDTAGKEVRATIGEDLGEAAVAVVSIEGILVVGGVASVAAMVYSVVQAWGIGDLAQSYKPQLENTRTGFRAGMSCGAAPTDQYGKAGYAAGQQNYQALFDRTKKANVAATDDAVKAAIIAKADDARNEVAQQLDAAVRVGLWDGYLVQHNTLLVSGDAKWAFVACFGDLPKDSDAEWKKYVAQHPIQSNF